MKLELYFWILSFLFLIAGASLGSFFKVIVDRYGTGETIIFKPSYCFNCKKNLLWWQNIPVFSFLFLRGKCFFCKEKIDKNCFFSELFAALFALILFIFFYLNKINLYESISIFLFFIVLILLSMFDLKHRIIPHTITYSAIVIAILIKIFSGQSYLSLFACLGIAFIFMDLLYVFATRFKKFEIEQNLNVIPLLIWVSIFFFFNNLYLLIIPVALYFLFLKINLSKRLYFFLWLLLFILLVFQIYKIALIEFNFDKLVLFSCGIGIIYFICEVLFYFFSLFLPFASHSSPVTTEITLGGGDITVFALISVFSGYKVAFFTLFIASLLSIFSLLVMKLWNKQKEKYVPFVPFLSLASFIIIIIYGR